MNILAVESSCDETAVAIVRDGRTVLTDCIASQVALHREYGGVVPEIASRKHIEAIYGLADQALAEAAADYDEPYPGARERVIEVLRVMLSAWICSRFQAQVSEMVTKLQ